MVRQPEATTSTDAIPSNERPQRTDEDTIARDDESKTSTEAVDPSVPPTQAHARDPSSSETSDDASSQALDHTDTEDFDESTESNTEVDDHVDEIAHLFAAQSTISHSSYHRFRGERVVTGPGYAGDDDTYVSTRGNVHDTTQPPPEPCFNCGEYHWRRDCPRARIYDP